MPRIKFVDWRATYTGEGNPYTGFPRTGTLALRATCAITAVQRAERVARMIDPTAEVVLVERVR